MHNIELPSAAEGKHLDFRQIGAISVSTMGLGCNNFARKLDYTDSQAVVDAALELGINYFDTADRYGYGDHPYSRPGGSEEFLGRALGSRRSEVVLATKFGNPMDENDPSRRGGSRRWVLQACEDSLRRLGTDYIDIYQIHRPDSTVPVAETLGALGELVEQGKVRAIGCSNFTAEQLQEAEETAEAHGSPRFESVQNEYSLLTRAPEEAVLPLCEKLDISFLPYFPLASGLLTGKYRKGEAPPEGTRLAFWKPREHFEMDDDLMDRVDRLAGVAEALGHSILELALGWLQARPVVKSVIAGATSPQQVRDNVAASTWTLSDEELAAVDQI
jgi:aryl-alcohol dehydrogenase-like predicted oxidoreductase